MGNRFQKIKITINNLQKRTTPSPSRESRTNNKKIVIDIPEFYSLEEEEKFKKLLTEIPHIKMPQHIRKVELIY